MTRLVVIVGMFLLVATAADAQNFTIEINRGQPDAISLSTPKTGPNGLALTWTFDKHNVDLVAAGDPPLPNEPTYLREVTLLPALQSWRRQQLNEGVVAAYAAASEATKASIRALLGL